MKKKISLSTVRKFLLAILLVVTASGVGYYLGSKKITVATIKNREMIKEGVDFNAFWDVWNRLEKSYLETKDLDQKKMVHGAISGMTAALGDPYTTYLPPAENKQSKEDLNGEFAGVGIQLGYIEKTLAVMAPLSGQPAEKAGIKAGDLILHIKDEKKGIDVDTDGMSLTEAVQNIRGAKGESVILTLFREGDKQTKDYTLVRDTIVVPSVELKWVDQNGKITNNGEYAHLMVSKFGEKTMEEWNKSVTEIVNNKKAKGIILDLRNNPGGFLQRAIDLGSEFVGDGIIVQQQGKYETESFSVNHRGRLVGKNLVVLINKGSASASEILAGALREQVNAKLVGENSFGKGTVQEAQDLPGGAGLHVTIAKWLLPKGTNIHKVGLKPDVEVKLEEPKEGEELKDTQLIKAIEVLTGNVAMN